MLRGSSLLIRSFSCASAAAGSCFARGCRPRASKGIAGRRPCSVAVFSTSSSSPSSSPSPSSSSSAEEDPSWLRRDLAIVLVHPQIPQNAGSAARTAAATRIPLHLVGPLGFEVDDKRLKRAGLDYWEAVCLSIWPDWGSFVEGVSSSSNSSSSSSSSSPSSSLPRFVAFSKRGNTHYASPGIYGNPTPQNPTFLLFGAETTGLPEAAHAASSAVVRLPIEQRHVRSLNLAVSVGVGAYEALRQVDGVKELPEIGG